MPERPTSPDLSPPGEFAGAEVAPSRQTPADGDLARQAGDLMLSGGEVVPNEIIVHMNGQCYRVPYVAEQTILQAVLAAGISPAFSCKAGLCAACTALCLKGRIVLDYNNVYSQAELAEGWILTCQAHAFGPRVEVTYDI